jgi:hypothetical protein
MKYQNPSLLFKKENLGCKHQINIRHQFGLSAPSPAQNPRTKPHRAFHCHPAAHQHLKFAMQSSNAVMGYLPTRKECILAKKLPKAIKSFKLTRFPQICRIHKILSNPYSGKQSKTA